MGGGCGMQASADHGQRVGIEWWAVGSCYNRVVAPCWAYVSVPACVAVSELWAA